MLGKETCKEEGAMHNIGDIIVYGSSGVMRIVDIRDEVIGGDVRKYYVLCSNVTSLNSQTFVPVDNERLVSQMRPLLTKREVLDILHNIESYPEPKWIPENRARTENFKTILESGDRGRILAMIRSIYKTGLRRVEEGKKNYLSDENIMNKAEKILYAEFSIALGIPEEEVPEFVARETERVKA